jgi:hypothetical protein
MNLEANLKSISDSELLLTTKRLATEEMRIGIEVLHHLKEVDDRRLFASIGFSSLFSYCTGELRYSEGGAYRRISAMRLLSDVPQYESKLKEGTVSVATLSQVQSFLVQEKRQFGKTYSQGEKMELLAKVEGKSSHQTERVLATISPQSSRAEKERVLNEDETEIRFTASRELMIKIERLKNLLGHKPEAQSYAGLIGELVDLGIKKLDPLEKPLKPQKPIKSDPSLKPGEFGKSGRIESTPQSSLPPVEVAPSESKSPTRFIPVAIKRAVWSRDGGRCTYQDPKTGRHCESRHALELEHVRPFGLGGQSSFENLRLLCSTHNQCTAIQAYGLQKMQKHWRGKTD